MPKRISRRQIASIVCAIERSSGKGFTWAKVCSLSEPVLDYLPTRQALCSHVDIKDAYDAKKAESVKNAPTRRGSGSASCYRIIAELRSEKEYLKKREEHLLGLIVKLQYNAYKNGMSEAMLNEDLPRIDRDRSDGA